MRTVTRTVYGAAINSALQLGIPFIPPENSTLNQKFSINPTLNPGPSERYRMNYITIGNGGHQAVTGADGIPYTTPNNHAATDASLYRHIPFVLRELSDDLTVGQRANYALRRIETHDGVQYAAYYAKRLDLESAEINLQKTNVVDGIQSTQPFVPTSANLNPVPMSASEQESNVILSSGDFVTASSPITIEFDAVSANELRNVAMVLYGSENLAVISEIGFVAGVERDVTGVAVGGTTINYRDIIAAMITTHVTVFYQLNLQNYGFTLSADVGVTEPLFAIADP